MTRIPGNATRQRAFCANARAVLQLPPQNNNAANQQLSADVGNAVRLTSVLPPDVVHTLTKSKKDGGAKRKKGIGSFGKEIVKELDKLPTSNDPNLLKTIAERSLAWLTKDAEKGKEHDTIGKRKAEICRIIQEQGTLQSDLEKLVAEESKGLPDLARTNRYQKLFEQSRQLKLDSYLCTGHELEKAKGNGQSECKLITSGNSVVCAFKPVDGEASNQKGHTVREAVASRVFQEIRRSTGLDFGGPIATAAKVGEQVGVVIDGVNGKQIDSHKLQHDASIGDALVNQVAPKEFQKLLLSSIITSNMDSKFENVFLTPNNELIPFDNGGTFPSEDTLVMTLTSRAGVSVITGDCYLREPYGRNNYLPFADQPLDASLKSAFMNIDTKQVKETADREASRLEKEFGSTVDTSTTTRTVKSIEIAQQILTQDPTISAKDFMKTWWTKYAAFLVSDIVDQRYRTIAITFIKDPNADPQKKQMIVDALRAIDAFIANPDLDVNVRHEVEALDRLKSELAFATSSALALVANINTWKRATKYIERTKDSAPEVQAFWDAVTQLIPANRLKLLYAVIKGSEAPYHLPPDSLDQLNPPFQVRVRKSAQKPIKFEAVHSCVIIKSGSSVSDLLKGITAELAQMV